MIIGDPANLAIESDITRAIQAEERIYSSGLFVLHVGGTRYGVYQPDATLLGCSVDEVEDRIARRGQHLAPFASEPAGDIADAFRDAIYAPDQNEKQFFGISRSRFEDLIHTSRVTWAPDGDEAFDDGSYVLQFDIDEKVRVIAFKCSKHGYHHDAETLQDVWMNGDEFYGVLQQWRSAYADAWNLTQKKA